MSRTFEQMPKRYRKTQRETEDIHRRQVFNGEFPKTFLDIGFLCDHPWEPGHTCPEAEAASTAEDRK